jgi:hypothetical protein
LGEVVIGPEVNQFFFGEFMWRYVAAERLSCCERPGVNQQPGDEFVVGENYERHSVIAFRIVWLK